MNHVKTLKGWPPRHAPSKLVQLWHKSFPPEHIPLDQHGLVEMKNLFMKMKNPTRLGIKTMSHICMSHVTHMNESCHTMSHVTLD